MALALKHVPSVIKQNVTCFEYMKAKYTAKDLIKRVQNEKHSIGQYIYIYENIYSCWNKVLFKIERIIIYVVCVW